MHKMPVNVQKACTVFLLVNDMVVKYLVIKRPGCSHRDKVLCGLEGCGFFSATRALGKVFCFVANSDCVATKPRQDSALLCIATGVYRRR
jgi:hypothetical protein